MGTTTPAAVLKQIASASPDPIYLLQGDDEVEKSALASAFGGLVEEDLRAFNVERIHAGEWTTGDKLADGVATIGGPYAADDGAASGCDGCPGRHAAGSEARERLSRACS